MMHAGIAGVFQGATQVYSGFASLTKILTQMMHAGIAGVSQNATVHSGIASVTQSLKRMMHDGESITL